MKELLHRPQRDVVMPVSERGEGMEADYIQHEVICVQQAMNPKERRRSSGDAAYVIACIQRSRGSQLVDRSWRQKRILRVQEDR
jgi:hypothetical protein